MKKEFCPLCNSKCSTQEADWGTYINCESGHQFTIHDSVEYGSDIEVIKRYNLIYEIILRTPFKLIDGSKNKWKFFYEDNEIGSDISDPTKINLANNMSNYPLNFADKMDRILLNLSYQYPNQQEMFVWEEKNARLMFCNSKLPDDMRAEERALLQLLEELRYVKHNKEKNNYSIAATGWNRISVLHEKEQAMNQGFIAMRFGSETYSIRIAFKEAISKCHYAISIIDEKEHNNQIVPEIFSEISKSKFVVVDVSFPNYGAYYEAGYAQGLGKQVIVCCKKEVFDGKSKENTPHFDISQKAMIIWDTEEDLVDKLVRRIDATVGKNKMLEGAKY
ncbi:MAG: hypothetical protein PHY47_19465 [Lachnospiraceae bacterium]|nr:hypothetical protein [Lachnospiraceae bacterium]